MSSLSYLENGKLYLKGGFVVRVAKAARCEGSSIVPGMRMTTKHDGAYLERALVPCRGCDQCPRPERAVWNGVSKLK